MATSGDYLTKLDGARRHLDNLDIEIEKWFHQDHYTLLVENDPKGGPEDWQIRMVADNPPPHWPIMIGDILHNLRGALDHLIFALASAYSPHPLTKQITEKSEFPIYGDKRSEGVIVVEARYCGDITRKLGGIAPKAKAIIQSLQPYHAGDAYVSKPLWQLHELSNIDKHRLLLICAFSSRSAMYNISSGSNFDFTGGNAVYNARLKPDAVVMRFTGRKRDPRKKMNVEFYPLAEAIFDGAPIVDGKDVIVTLNALFDYVRVDVIPPLVKFL